LKEKRVGAFLLTPATAGERDDRRGRGSIREQREEYIIREDAK
jgi:hypothetical protein